jgi:hypothetical protein
MPDVGKVKVKKKKRKRERKRKKKKEIYIEKVERGLSLLV